MDVEDAILPNRIVNYNVGAPYYTGFFITVISESYANGETHVKLTPEHVAVLKDLLKDYGMQECRRSHKDPACLHKRRLSDYAKRLWGRNENGG